MCCFKSYCFLFPKDSFRSLIFSLEMFGLRLRNIHRVIGQRYILVFYTPCKTQNFAQIGLSFI